MRSVEHRNSSGTVPVRANKPRSTATEMAACRSNRNGVAVLFNVALNVTLSIS